jgi:DNA-binding SARP family transcriptional activator
MGILRISLFGSVRIVHDDWSSEVRIAPKVQGLLAYLLLHGPRFHARERLADVFWTKYDAERARTCLNTALWRLRRALEPKGVRPETYLITGPSGELGFNWESEHWLDVRTFENQVTPVLARSVGMLLASDIEALETALDLYTGDLLECFYDDWAVREQERLRLLRLACWEHLMRFHQENGTYEQGLAFAQRILEWEPTHEEIHREVMAMYLAGGQRALAVRQYEICREVLARELGLDPMEETQALCARAKEGGGLNQEGSRNKLQPPRVRQARKQLSLAMNELGEAQKQLSLANCRLQQAQHRLQQTLQLFGRAAGP